MRFRSQTNKRDRNQFVSVSNYHLHNVCNFQRRKQNITRTKHPVHLQRLIIIIIIAITFIIVQYHRNKGEHTVLYKINKYVYTKTLI